MKTWITRLRATGVTAMMPRWARTLGHHLFGAASDRDLWRLEHDRVVAQARRMPVDPARPTVGIAIDLMGRHSYYEAACLELGVPFRLVDVTGTDWREQVRGSGCRLLFVRPFVLTPEGKALYDERAERISRELDVRVFPDLEALRLYESKHRGAAWLQSHGVPQPDTRVFHDPSAAVDYLRGAAFPLVFKTDLGSETAGVRILRTRRDAERVVRECFGPGYRLAGRMRSVRQRGSVLFQEFVADAREWRMVRIGDSFFGHRKGKRGEFHSGSKIIEFDTPPERLLDLCRDITERGGFRSMAIDILEPPDGRCLVIELHAYFGCNSPHVMAVDGVPGRFTRAGARWRFEPGDFNRNNSCNLRVEYALQEGG